MFPLEIINFFIRRKIFFDHEAHKRQQSLFMKCINNANTWNFNINANTFFIIYFKIWKVLAIKGNSAIRMSYPPVTATLLKLKLIGKINFPERTFPEMH